MSNFEGEKFPRVTQAVVAAGGKGTRITPELNPNGSKVLIEYNGKSLFEYLIESLIDGGIEKILVATANHTDTRIREIMKTKQVESVVFPISEMGSFRWIPYYFQDLLSDRFLFVCGHQPLSPSLVNTILTASERNRFISAFYSSNLFSKDRAAKMKIIYNAANGSLVKDDLMHLPERLLIDSPYILSKDIVFEFTDSHSNAEYSNFIVKRTKTGSTFTAVPSAMPPEFDYDEELFRTIESLKQQTNI